MDPFPAYLSFEALEQNHGMYTSQKQQDDFVGNLNL